MKCRERAITLALSLCLVGTFASGQAKQDDCSRRIKSIDTLTEEGLGWVKDDATYTQLSSEFESYLACVGYAANPADACKAFDKIGPVIWRMGKSSTRPGDLAHECQYLSAAARYYNELYTVKSGSYPACIEFESPPYHGLMDPKLGDFSKVCKEMAEHLQASNSDFPCSMLAPFYAEPRSNEQKEIRCHAGIKARLGDISQCAITKTPYCLKETAIAKAMRSKNHNACPTGGIANGICRALVAPNPKAVCAQAWAQLQTDYCRARATGGI